MIKYDYSLIRDEKTEKITFTPNPKIPKELSNLVYIEGPNVSGKSTLLHLLALSFHGLKDSSIIEDLQKKMNNLINGDVNQIRFKITITDKEGKVAFTAEKKDLKSKEIILRDSKGDIVSDVNFRRKYRLIYDIPANPTERLKDLTKSIKEGQNDFSQKLSGLRGFVVQIAKDIREAKDPDKIKSVKNDIGRINTKKLENIEKMRRNVDFLKTIQIYTYVKYYMFYKKSFADSSQYMKGLEKENKKASQYKVKHSKEYKVLIKELEDKREELKNLYNEVTISLKKFFSADKKYKNLLSPWLEVSIAKEISEPDIYRSLEIDGNNFLDILKKMQEKEEKEKSLLIQEVRLYKELLKLLENFPKLTIKVPGIDLSVDKFIQALKEKMEGSNEMVAESELIAQTIEKIHNILNCRKYIVSELLPDIKSTSLQCGSEKETEDEKVCGKHEKEKEKLEETRRLMERYRNACIKIDIPEENIVEMYQSVVLGRAIKSWDKDSESVLNGKINSMRDEGDQLSRDIKAAESNLEYLEREKERLEAKKPHEYASHFLFLQEVLLKKIQELERKMNIFNDFLEPLVFDRRIDHKLTTEENNYYEQVFVYLAKTLVTYPHTDGKVYRVKKIDLIKKEIITQDDRVIRMIDMSTGQSQSTFLTSLLDTGGDKKIIALIDEVAMIDQAHLKPIFNKMKSLYDNNKLLLGVVVQKAEKIAVQEIK